MSELEKKWYHCGLLCETFLHELGHRCGYVFIGKDHPLFGVDYFDMAEGPDVNGGLTYSGENRGSWVFGFDFGHCWDIPDDACVEYAVENSKDPEFVRSYLMDERRFLVHYARIATLDMAVEDCNKLAKWLDDMKDKPYVYKLELYGDKAPDEIVFGDVRYVKEGDDEEAAA